MHLILSWCRGSRIQTNTKRRGKDSHSPVDIFKVLCVVLDRLLHPMILRLAHSVNHAPQTICFSIRAPASSPAEDVTLNL